MTRTSHVTRNAPPPARRPELLAPAGNPAMALAAFRNGADAVYGGLQRFNARERADNFTLDTFGRLAAYARQHGKRVYLTLNTLLKETELDETAELLHAVESIRPHAVIVQDLGLVRMIRTGFPRLAIHASTQMGIHNSAGVRFVARRGIRRVILERQVTMDELRAIAADAPVELEVFAHGALCCSLSGQCLFSSWMGGWSGNRGRCKQPCRRRFCGPSGNGFFFSTADLYALDRLTELEQLGVASLKIEGRLQTVNHITQVVRAYRLLLDTPAPERPEALKEARRLLAEALGRRWSHGFLDTASAARVIQADSPGVSGRLCGRVTAVHPRGFEVAASQPIRRGDHLRIQPPSAEEGPTVTVTRLMVNRRPVNKLARGQTGTIACDKPVQAKARVYKTGHAATAAPSPEALPAHDTVVDLHVRVCAAGVTVLLAGLPDEWRHAVALEPARRHALHPDDVADAFRKGVPEGWGVADIEVDIDGELFLQSKQLRTIRQSFWAWAQQAVRRHPPADRPPTNAARLPENDPTSLLNNALPVETVTCLRRGADNPIPGTLTARPLAEADAATDEIVLPDFCPEGDLEALQRRVAAWIQQGGRRVRVTSLYGFDLLRGFEDLVLTAGFPLPAANSAAVCELFDAGVHKAQVWIELDADARDALRRRVPRGLELFAYGRPPLLTTRAAVPVAGPITDLRGGRFTVQRIAGLTRVYAGEVMAVPVPPDCSRYIDLSHADLEETDTNGFNTDRAWG